MSDNNNWDNQDNQDNFSSGSNDPGPFTQPGRPGDYGGNGGGYIPPQREMEFKDWIILNIVLLIPCVNIIMLLIWAFSKDNKTRSDFCKAYLIVAVVAMVIGFILTFIFSFAFAAMLSDLMYYAF